MVQRAEQVREVQGTEYKRKPCTEQNMQERCREYCRQESLKTKTGRRGAGNRVHKNSANFRMSNLGAGNKGENIKQRARWRRGAGIE